MPVTETAATINGVSIDESFAEAFPMSGTDILYSANLVLAGVVVR